MGRVGAEVHHALDGDQVCRTHPCGQATVGVDKGYIDNDGERHGPGPAVRGERSREGQGTQRNRFRVVEQKHGAKGSARKADAIARGNLSAPMQSARYRHKAHYPLPERVGQGRHGGHPPFDFPASMRTNHTAIT